MIKNKMEIGVALLEYDQNGKPKSAKFTPAIREIDKDTMEKELLNAEQFIGSSRDTEQEIRSHAQVLLAYWFYQLEMVELADRETGKIESEIVKCEKWDNNRTIKTCEIRFFFVRHAK